MFADTDGIRALGSAGATLADDLAGVADALASLPAAPALGQVTARFMAALSEAAADGSRVASALSERLAGSGVTVYAAAAAYEDADRGAGTRVTEV